MVPRLVIGAVALVVCLGGSAAGAESTALWSIYLKVASANSTVTLTPTGELFDPNCPDNVCRFRYPAGTTVTLTAVTGTSSYFEGWQPLFTNRPASCAGTSQTCTLTMDGTKYVRGAFSPVQLWTSSNIGGHIDVVGGSSCGRGCFQFRYGTRARVFAVDHGGYHFDRWNSTRCSAIRTSGCNFPMIDNNFVSAYFARNDGLGQQSSPVTIYVSFQARLRGTGTGIVTGPSGLSCPSRCNIDYERGRQIALTATGTGGSRFIGWGGACVNARGPTCVFRAVPTASGGDRWASAWFNRP